jgi:pheromone a factor receptor
MGYQAALIVLSLIAIVLLIPPLVWHIKTVNIPAIMLIIWLLLMVLKSFIDAIIWGGDGFYTRFDGVGYCDVMVKLQVGASVGISASVAAIMFNLFRILKADSVIPGLRSFKKITIDLLISLLTPLIVMGLSYLVQARRYYIFRYSGCQNIMAPSYVSILINTVWLVIWSLVGVIFAVLIILKFFKKRKDVKDILRCTNSGLTLVRFSKLLIFCVIIILVMFPLSIYIFVSDMSNVQGSYDFALIHNPSVWFTVSYVPNERPLYSVWIFIALSYVVFIFFGLGSDAIDMYLQLLSKVGFGPFIEYVRHKRQEKKILKADELVSKVLNSENSALPSVSGETAFDLELQQIMNTETPTSNIFSDRHAFYNPLSATSDHYRDNQMEFDDDDVQYLNLLYQSKDVSGKRDISSSDLLQDETEIYDAKSSKSSN